MTVKSGAGGIHAEGAVAAGEIQRLGQVIPGAKAEIIAAALAITQEGVMVTLKATPPSPVGTAVPSRPFADSE